MANVVNEIRHDVEIRCINGERFVAMPEEAWKQIWGAFKAWEKDRCAMSYYRVEIYKPIDGAHSRFSHRRLACYPLGKLADELCTYPPGSFALVLEVGVQGGEFAQDEDVRERWRVTEDGRVLRSRYSVTDVEHEVPAGSG